MESILKNDTVTPSFNSDSLPVTLFTKQDLRNKTDIDAQALLSLPQTRKIINKQQPDGSWKYPSGNKKVRIRENYKQLRSQYLPNAILHK